MKEPQIAGLLTPILAALGLELEAVDLIPAGKRKLLRIVVDGDGSNGRGPNLDDIAAATRAISDALDTADVTGASPYTLEVSSRGVGRALELPRHWRRNSGRLVSVTTATGERLTGRISSTTEDAAELTVDGATRSIAYAEVTKAQVQVELNPPRGGADDPIQTDDDPDDDESDDPGDDEPDDSVDDEKES